MSGKITSECNRISIFPPDQTTGYLLELQQTDNIRIWLLHNGQRSLAEEIPLDVVPFMDVLLQRRKREKKHSRVETVAS